MGREGGSAGGRCKYVHVSSVAASMRLTPPADPPSRPWTVFCAPREDQKKSQRQKPTLQTFLVSAIHAWRGSTVSTKIDTYQQQRRTHSDRSRKTVEGGVGPVAGVSAAWMPRPSPQGRVYGVPRHRTRPAIPQ
ncbi:hypothetical protein B9Y75_15035 [Stenotrophomonas maltophilia]|nr:hypothetical protein B9Y75_15035 [Stenotrophomonas maltophilia]